MGTLNERDKHREKRDELSENRFVADDRRASGVGRSYGLILAVLGGLSLAGVVRLRHRNSATINNSPSINAPATSPPTPPATPERQPSTNP